MLKKSENLVSAPNVLRDFQITMMTINSFVTGESWLNFQVSFCLPWMSLTQSLRRVDHKPQLNPEGFEQHLFNAV